MAEPPIAPRRLDLLWSEGAAYNIGFENALSLWRPLLAPNGIAVLSECTWLSDDRPDDVVAFWTAAYPAMGTITENIERAAHAGYDVLETTTLPAEAWDDYYAPIFQAVEDGNAAHLDPAFTAELAQERAIWRASRGSYGYVFYSAKPKAAS